VESVEALSQSRPLFRVASDRETGARCPHCSAPVERGAEIAACDQCGSVHHAACWHAHGGCGSFDCCAARRVLAESDRQDVLRISMDEIEQASPLPAHPPLRPGLSPIVPEIPSRRLSRLALAAFIVALAGIPLFGVLTGLVAIVLGSLALGGIHQTQQRGTGLALTAVLLGLADMIGWVVFLGMMFSGSESRLAQLDFEPDAAALENLPPRIARAVRANVLIETQRGSLRTSRGIGSGVILQLRAGTAVIVTNRHVVDPGFTGDDSPTAGNGRPAGQLQVKLIGQPMQPGTVVWTAPDGIDLALLTVPVLGEGSAAAPWQPDRKLAVGEDVFSIGNPQHLDWSLTRGSISQLRLHTRGARKIHVIQTDAALNPGNSGGGLYDQNGLLVGINTWTNDKRFSEGLGFAIVLDSLLSLDPPPLRTKAEASPPSAP
jgi:S1-C subfamily serine protease